MYSYNLFLHLHENNATLTIHYLILWYNIPMDKKLLVQLLLLKKGIQKENNTKFDKLQKEFLNKLESIQLKKGDQGDAYSITDKDYAEIASLVTLPEVKDGNDYVLTQEDKETIASLVELPIAIDGKDYILTDEDKDQIASLVPILEIPEFAEKSIEEIRDSLEDLTDEEKLDVLKLKNLDKIELDASQIRNLQNTSSKGVSGMTRYAVEKLVKESGGGVEQYANLEAFPATGKTDILYIAIDSNLSYIWTGSVYVKVGDGADTVWGDITGTLADQTDLQEELDKVKTIVGTREFVLSKTPENGTIGFSIDKGEKYLYADGWQQASTVYRERTGAFDIGAIQDSNLGGYGRDYISQKHLSDVTIGGNSETKEGGTRTIYSTTLKKRIAQYYLNGAWRTALTGISIQTDTAESPPDIEFTDFEPYRISLITGNSDATDINGVPVVQNMKTDMGAFQSPLEINGGIL